MGDTGSLALGAMIISVFIILKKEVLLIFFCIIPILETLSVILQVGYFKISKGKRIFKMAPFHHHLQMVGLKEPKVVAIYSAITICLGVNSILNLFYNNIIICKYTNLTCNF